MNAEEKRAAYLEMARCTYEPQMTAWKTKDRILLPGAWSIGGKIHPTWTLTLFGPLAGEFTREVDGSPDTMECTKEYRMYWKAFPDFRLDEWRAWPKEDGWIARQTFRGTGPDGTIAEVHQADIATVDEAGRLVRMEWFVDNYQWQSRVLTVCSRLPVEEVRKMTMQPGGYGMLIDYVNALPESA